MENSVSYILNSLNLDWVAILALIIAIISVIIAVNYNRETLKLTEVHNKKSVEPLISDLYSGLTISEKDKYPLESFQLKNCGFGPAIIKSFQLEVDNKIYKTVFDIYNEHIGTPKYIQD